MNKVINGSASNGAIDAKKLVEKVSSAKPIDSEKKAALEKTVQQIAKVSDNIKTLKDSGKPTKITEKSALKEWKKKPRPLQTAQVLRIDNSIDNFAETDASKGCGACDDKKSRVEKFAEEMKKFR